MQLEYRHLKWLSLIWDTDLDTKAKITAAALSDHMNSNHDIAWPSMDRLARMTSQSKRTIIRAVQTLEKAGWLAIQKGGINKGTSRYKPIFPPSIDKILAAQFTGVTESPAGATESPVLVSHSHPNIPIESAHNNQTPRARRFHEFWEAYPKHVGKIPAERAWTRLTAKQRQLAIDDCRDRYANQSKNFIPNPATYLNQQRWTDERISHEAHKPTAHQNSGDFLRDCQAFALGESGGSPVCQDAGEIRGTVVPAVGYKRH